MQDISKFQMVTPPTVKEPVAEGVAKTDECGDRFTQRFIIWRTDSHWMDWEVHESGSALQDGTRLFSGDPDCSPSPLDTDRPTPASCRMDGFIKWDNCTQWRYGAHEGGDDLWHYDGLDDVPDVRDIIRQVRDIARANMPRYDKTLE